MAFAPFLSNNKKSKDKDNFRDKKIDFSQKLALEDEDELPKKSPAPGGSFNIPKKQENQNNNTQAKVLTKQSPEDSKPNSNIKDKEEITKSYPKRKVNIFLRWFKKRSNKETSALDVNLVKGEITKFFDWQRNFLILFVFIFLSLAILSFSYWAISWWGSKIEYQRDPFLLQNYFKLDKEIKSLEEDIAEIIYFKNKIILVDDLLNNHIYWSNFFTFLEDKTLTDVSFSSFSGNTAGDYNLSAQTNNLDIIDVQIKEFILDEYIKTAKVDSGAISSSGEDSAQVLFNLNFSINPNLFTK